MRKKNYSKPTVIVVPLECENVCFTTSAVVPGMGWGDGNGSTGANVPGMGWEDGNGSTGANVPGMSWGKGSDWQVYEQTP
ncbi:MAG: hypothetical protein E7070_05715 [Bacteroidales bacterium]|jgi:hypothetical protein|nr:hypothetical protein [Bacteroidales bacterium]